MGTGYREFVGGRKQSQETVGNCKHVWVFLESTVLCDYMWSLV